jgi:hypothetical protein
MRAFVRVVEQESFSAAAAVLGLTPSAVSRLVSKLEDRLGAVARGRSQARLGPFVRGLCAWTPPLTQSERISRFSSGTIRLSALATVIPSGNRALCVRFGSCVTRIAGPNGGA